MVHHLKSFVFRTPLGSSKPGGASKRSLTVVRWVLVSLAVAIGLSSLRYLFLDVAMAPPDLSASLKKNGVIFIAHAAFAAMALIAGSVQFFPALRKHPLPLHRWTGRIYVVCCLLGGATAILIAPDVKSGVIATIGFSTLGVLWIASTIQGWRFAVIKDFASHRRWMLRSYALTAAAISLRIQLVAFAVAGMPYGEVINLLSFSCWLPNIIAVELWLASDILSEKVGHRTANH